MSTNPAPASVSVTTGTPARSWAAFARAEPALATAVRDRFARHRHHVLATLRKDGSPRVSGLEVDFRDGELWLGMMPGSLKARDLLRDPRLAVHANPGDDESLADGLPESGDVKISGRAVEVTDPAVLEAYAAAVAHPLPFHLFRVELTDVVRTRVEGDRLIVGRWQPGEPVVTRSRA
ncbi:pyridoxamine 5'-phosphate oxidase family protein [Streptomyces yaizuensis]|uniref:Pyridoxamine 5'-phosphate oxidase family protein n=1 Tax=Streptomyces yaizuensis TaxID=2989713 RepID=A0ABQ5P7F7_9ACTN|nr:pyridoxamine 5'-phosphate oxidase family protein [Streptomyces sp. YSPA8]GLF98520.1 pyridoxamine 5'-phosphate oxidase family protein [Streptomyces sp. YSPA8]